MHATQETIARRLGLDRSTVSKVLTNAPGAYVGDKTRARILSVARQLGYDFSRLRHAHHRAADRTPVQLSAGIRILLWDGTCHASGRAQIVNLSREGALLKNIQTEPASLPLKPCSIDIDFTPGATPVRATGEIVRFQTTGFVELGIRFTSLADEARDAIDEFLTRNAAAVAAAALSLASAPVTP